MKLVNRQTLKSIFGDSIGHSITITMRNQGIEHIEKTENNPCVINGKQTTMRQQIQYWSVSDMFRFYSDNTEHRYKKKYAQRAKILKGLLDDTKSIG